MDIDINEWMAKQESVYARFRSLGARVRQKGIMPDPLVRERREGFVVALEHPRAVAEAAVRVSKKIAGVVPAVAYRERSVHTTLADILPAPGHGINPDQSTGESLLSRLADGVRGAMDEIRDCGRCLIRYDEVLWNNTTVIFCGMPNEAFLRISEAVRASCQNQGLAGLRRPWGAHITVSRFARRVDAERLQPLLDCLGRATPPGPSEPIAVIAGKFFVDQRQGIFSLIPYERFPL